MTRRDPDIEAMFQEVLGSDIEMAQWNLIHPEGSGFRVFDRYVMTPGPDHTRLTWGLEHTLEFSSTRSALSWCIADKYRQAATATEILQLDQRRRQLRDDIAMTRQLRERARDHSQREVLDAKISHKRQLLTDADNRLDKCVALAKYWQIRGFNDEIARTRRPAPNTTNRSGNRRAAR